MASPFPPKVLDQLRTQAPFLWHLRDLAVASPKYTLTSLARLDERLDGHLDALSQLTPQEIDEVATAMSNTPGGLFVVSSIAFRHRRANVLLRSIGVAATNPVLARGFVSAAGWLENDDAGAVASYLLNSQEPSCRAVGLAVYGVRRQDPGLLLASALQHQDAAVRARALLCLRQLGRVDLASQLSEHLYDTNEAVRLEAAISGVIFNSAPESIPESINVLKQLVLTGKLIPNRSPGSPP
jgi:uncharacterized protein (TIGR02270 family)